MKKIFKSRSFYVVLFVAGVVLIVNVAFTAMLRRNINNERKMASEHKVIDTKKEYPESLPEEVSSPVKIEVEESVGIKEPIVEQEETNEFIWPVNGDIINEFSGNELVYSKTLKEYRVHNGIDIKSSILAQVLSCKKGVVESVTKDGLMGITITIDHSDGFKSVYSNLSSDEMVKPGQSVRQGEIISGIGDTALIETGEEAHLHFELLKDGIQVDPKLYIEK